MLFTSPRYLYPVQTLIAAQKLFEIFPPEICRIIASYTDDQKHAKLRYEIYITTLYRNSEITDKVLIAYTRRHLRAGDKLKAWTAQKIHSRIQASNALDILNYAYVNLRSKRVDRARFARFKIAVVAKITELTKDATMLTYYPREIMLLKELVAEE